MQTGFFLFTVGGAFLCRHNVPALIGGCFPFAYADAYWFGLPTFISCILLVAAKALCGYPRLSSLHFTFRASLYLSAPVFSQQARRIFSRLCSLIAFLANSPLLLSALVVTVPAAGKILLFFVLLFFACVGAYICGRFMYSDCILLLIKREPFFSCECRVDRPMVALSIVRFFLHKTHLVFPVIFVRLLRFWANRR